MTDALIFVDDSLPGFTRRRTGRGWCYRDADGRRITDRTEIDRLNAIGLPPAYRDAWFCPHPNGHMLATGIDARGRKQYRYHPDFRRERECVKYDALARFGEALPAIRRRLADALAGRAVTHAITRDHAVACVVRLLDTGAIRVGNEAYVRANGSFGATTLRKRHAALSARRLRLRFRAKSGKLRELDVQDRDLLRFVRAVQDLPGQHLFQFIDDDGAPCPVGSADVNAWLRETTGEDFTARHFRTWHASTIAFEALIAGPPPVSALALGRQVAERLGNTPAVARRSYIHPALLDLAGDVARQGALASRKLPRATRWLSRSERGLLALLHATPGSADLLAA